jgi:hypothetical protein
MRLQIGSALKNELRAIKRKLNNNHIKYHTLISIVAWKAEKLVLAAEKPVKLAKHFTQNPLLELIISHLLTNHTDVN